MKNAFYFTVIFLLFSSVQTLAGERWCDGGTLPNFETAKADGEKRCREKCEAPPCTWFWEKHRRWGGADAHANPDHYMQFGEIQIRTSYYPTVRCLCKFD